MKVKKKRKKLGKSFDGSDASWAIHLSPIDATQKRSVVILIPLFFFFLSYCYWCLPFQNKDGAVLPNTITAPGKRPFAALSPFSWLFWLFSKIGFSLAMIKNNKRMTTKNNKRSHVIITMMQILFNCRKVPLSLRFRSRIFHRISHSHNCYLNVIKYVDTYIYNWIMLRMREERAQNITWFGHSCL